MILDSSFNGLILETIYGSKIFQLVTIFDPNIENQTSIKAQNVMALHLFHKEIMEFVFGTNKNDIKETLQEHSIRLGSQIITSTSLLIKKTTVKKVDIR